MRGRVSLGVALSLFFRAAEKHTLQPLFEEMGPRIVGVSMHICTNFVLRRQQRYDHCGAR